MQEKQVVDDLIHFIVAIAIKLNWKVNWTNIFTRKTKYAREVCDSLEKFLNCL